MKLTLIKNFIFYIGQRVIIIFIILFLCVNTFLDFKKIIVKARMATLNRLMPQDYEYLKKIENNPTELDLNKLEPYTFYFRKANQYLPHHPDLLGLLGFCYYHSAEKKKALKTFEEAYKLNPLFLGHIYNLALIKYQNGNFDETIALLENALKIDYAKQAEYLFNSRVYRPIIFPSANSPEDLSRIFKNAYQRTYQLLALSCYQKKKYEQLLKVSAEAINRDLDRDGSFTYFAGLTILESKEFGKALHLFQESIKKNPGHAENFYSVGKTLEGMGETAKAEVFFKTAEELKNKGKVFEFNSTNFAARIF